MWYIEKGLADLVSSEPFTVKLNFQPNGLIEKGQEEFEIDNEYYATDRKNCCVMCGNQEQFSRFHVVPTLYRTNFPDAMKSHRSHDVLLLCFECHCKAQRSQNKIKSDLARKHNISLTAVSPYFDLNKDIKVIKSAAVSLREHKAKMIPSKLDEQKNKIIKLLVDSNALLKTHVPADVYQMILECKVNEPQTLPEKLCQFCETMQ